MPTYYDEDGNPIQSQQASAAAPVYYDENGDPLPPSPPLASVADTARTRLSRRGLTPEQIRASPPSGPLPPRYSELYSGFGEMLGLDDDSGFEYKPRTTDGGYFSNLGRWLNPKEIAAGMGERGINQLLTVMDPTGGPDSLPLDERSNRGVDMTDLGVPDLPAIYQEASRRGEQGESLAGMYGSASAQALLAGAGFGAGRLIRSAPARAAAAETQYAEATGATPPVAREMIARRMVIGADPAPQAAAQRAQAAAINAERSAIPVSRPVRGARGRFQPSTDPVDVANAAERSALRARADMETNIAQILEATPETRTALGAVGKGTGRFAKSRLTLASGVVGASTGWSPASLMSLSPVAATHLLWSISKELVKTNQWQTALPIYKTRFANALMTGNADLAAATGALIASGRAVASDSKTGLLAESPINRARKELADTGITSEQAAAYRPVVSKLLRKGVDPSDEYSTPEDVMGIAKRFLPSLLSKDAQRQRELSSPEATEDAWRLYLGIPQKSGTFDISDYAPTKGTGDAPYYFRIKEFFPRLLADWGMPDPDKKPADSVKGIVRVVSASPDRKFVAYDDTMANYTLTLGRDARGHYIAYYDKWDLAPSVLEDSQVPIDKLVGKPLEIYDRLYYDPVTFEPIKSVR